MNSIRFRLLRWIFKASTKQTDYTLKRGDKVTATGWPSFPNGVSMEIVDINWALRAAALKFGSAIVVLPTWVLRRMKDEQQTGD